MPIKVGSLVRIWPGIEVAVAKIDGERITVQWQDAKGVPHEKVIDAFKILALVKP